MRILFFIINKGRLIKSSGFTLVELMVVISIIGILTALLLPSISGSRSLATRTACINNLRQIILAAQSYAHDDRQGALTAAFKDDDNDLNNLYSSYMQNLKVFSCPAGRQIIRSNAYLKILSPTKRFLLIFTRSPIGEVALVADMSHLDL